MSAFRVGQRVKRVADGPAMVPIGSTGTVTGFDPGFRSDDPAVKWDAGPLGDPTCVYYDHATLAPLTPPASDEWAADKVKSVTRPLHVEPVAPKVTV